MKTEARLREEAEAELRKVYDPEIPVDIWELGLVYRLDVDAAEGRVDVQMTLTSPACPVGADLVAEVEERLAALEGVRAVRVELTWDPPWGPEHMTEAARLELGFF